MNTSQGKTQTVESDSQLSELATGGTLEILRLKAFTFAIYLTTAVYVSYFPLYFEHLDYSKTEIGLLYAFGPFIGIAANLFWGVLSDRLKTIKSILLIVLGGQFASALIVQNVHSFASLFVTLLAFNFFYMSTIPLNDSQLLIASKQLKRSYVSFRVWGSIGFSFSAVFFGWILSLLGAGQTVLIAMCTIGLAFLIGLGMRDRAASAQTFNARELLAIIRSRQFLWFMLLILLVSISHRVNETFLGIFMAELGADSSQVGLAWMTSALSEIPILFLLGKYGHKLKELPLLAFASAAYAIRFCLVAIAHDPLALVGTQLLHSISLGIYMVTAVRYLQQLIPDEYRASGQALYAVVWTGLAGFISGSVGGTIYDASGARALYFTAASLAALGSIGFLLTHLRKKV
jgi:PPP family 3-phenylpropionic acid transporter